MNEEQTLNAVKNSLNGVLKEHSERLKNSLVKLCKLNGELAVNAFSLLVEQSHKSAKSFAEQSHKLISLQPKLQDYYFMRLQLGLGIPGDYDPDWQNKFEEISNKYQQSMQDVLPETLQNSLTQRGEVV